MAAITRFTTGLGVLSWLVPFVVSFLFVDRAGQFVIPQPLFKSLMVVMFGGFGVALLVLAFRRVEPTLPSGAALGLVWLAINLALDFVIPAPLTGMSASSYLFDIGLRHLLIPIIATAMGVVAKRARRAG